MCNCLIYVIYKKIRYGGKIKWYRSKTWLGFHTTWVDSNGCEWEYTLEKIRKKPWWYIPLCYKGKIKKKELEWQNPLKNKKKKQKK